ncbi:hypothetical protein B0H34DRAFT_708387 [Crassisporium funariophilum]|nr:hypothetical protein B0H34DRAFT_708387 [Crassisporium funariophilum]
MIAMLSTAAFALGLIVTAKLARDSTFASLATLQAKAIMASSQGVTFLSGLAIFKALCFYLNPSQNPLVKPVEGIYENFVAYTIARGSLATAIQLGFFVTFVSMPTRPVWMPFHLVASKVFINSLLAMLNSREIHQGQGVNEEDVTSRRTNSTSFSSSGPGRINSNVRFDVVDSKPIINIGVTRTTENDNTTSKVVYDDDEADNWHRKRVGFDAR